MIVPCSYPCSWTRNSRSGRFRPGKRRARRRAGGVGRRCSVGGAPPGRRHPNRRSTNTGRTHDGKPEAGAPAGSGAVVSPGQGEARPREARSRWWEKRRRRSSSADEGGGRSWHRPSGVVDPCTAPPSLNGGMSRTGTPTRGPGEHVDASAVDGRVPGDTAVVTPGDHRRCRQDTAEDVGERERAVPDGVPGMGTRAARWRRRASPSGGFWAVSRSMCEAGARRGNKGRGVWTALRAMPPHDREGPAGWAGPEPLDPWRSAHQHQVVS